MKLNKIEEQEGFTGKEDKARELLSVNNGRSSITRVYIVLEPLE